MSTERPAGPRRRGKRRPDCRTCRPLLRRQVLRASQRKTDMNAIISRLGADLIGIVAAGFLATTASAQQFTMKMSFPTINDVTHEFYKTMKAGIERRAGGRIKVDIYPANQLGQIPAVVEGVALGTIEVGG